MTVFFTADSHFGHSSIIKLCKRPFDSVQQMNQVMIERWNSVVQPGDLVYHLGDFCFKGSKAAAKILEQLQGDIIFFRGNHDSDNVMKLPRWMETHDLLEVTVEEGRFALCHYPILEWSGAFRGVIHLHGHTHGRIPPHAQRCDVGVDVWNYTPVTAEQILERLSQAPAYDPRAVYQKFEQR